MQRGLVLAILIIGAGIISLELGISTAVVEILLGILARNIVPLFGISWDDFIGKGEMLTFLAHVGLMALLFIAGFEIDFDLLKQNLKSSLSVGLSSFFVPFLIVGLVSFFIFGRDLDKAAIAAISLSATSIALIFSYLRERGLHDKKVGQLLITCAMVVDIASVVLLVVFFIPVDTKFAIDIVILGLAILAAPAIGRLLLKRYAGNPNEFGLRFILFLLISFSFIAQSTRIHEALIGFALGLIMGRLLREHLQLVDKLSGIVFSFFAPVFFFYVGSQFVLNGMRTLDWLFAVLLLVISATAKTWATAAPLKRIISGKAARFGGTLFNYNLTFGLVAAFYGFNQGIITGAEYNVLLFVIVTTAFIPTFLHRHAPRELAYER